MKRLFFISTVSIFIGCSADYKKENNREEKVLEPTTEVTQKEELTDSIKQESTKMDTLEANLIAAGLVDVQTLNDSIFVELKYATTDNFMKKNLYGNLNKAYLQSAIAERLAKVQRYLSTIDSSLHLLVYDAVRPRSVQWKMWKGLDTIPVAQRIKFVSNPRNGSIHNYGCAIDLTLCNNDKEPLDMGAGYDDLKRIAYPRFEQEFLKKGELTKAQLNNRKLLRKVMRVGGFWVLQTEWWHFNGFSRTQAKKMYNAVE